MQILRTVLWIVITAVLVAFISMNWTRAPVNIWPLNDGYLFFEWPVGVIALVFFLLGLLPMWLLHRAAQWRLKRRIGNLESSVRAASAPAPSAPVVSATPSSAPAATTADVPSSLAAELAPQPHPAPPAGTLTDSDGKST